MVVVRFKALFFGAECLEDFFLAFVRFAGLFFVVGRLRAIVSTVYAGWTPRAKFRALL